MTRNLFLIASAYIITLLSPLKGICQISAPSCPTLAGTLTGSNTCNNAPGYLTFHSQSGLGPFTLTYSDGSQTYTQNNVMDGIPFSVQVQPTISTTYTLISIQNSSTTCLATQVMPGITTVINPGNCTLCTGAIGDPVINVTFGSGTGNSPPLEMAVPGASSTNVTYIPVTGNPALPVPFDGQYTITNNVPDNVDWFAGSPDHTGNANGYMLFENASVTPGEFFRQTVSDLCGSTKYEFAAWIANADNLALLTGVLPDLTFIVQTQDGTVLNTYDSGPVPQSYSWTWQQYGFLFTLPAGITTVVVRIINNSPGGSAQPGNDFAMDDITFRPCGPLTTASLSASASVTQQTICSGSSAMLYGAVSSGYTAPQYLWQISQDSGTTWQDLPASNNLQFEVTAPVAGRPVDYYYRLASADGSNIQSPSCRVVSNVIILSVTPGPNVDFSFDQSVCNPLQVQFAANALAGISYLWTINGSNYSSSTPGDPALPFTFSSFGTYPVTVTTTGGMCPTLVSKNITIQVQPANIISTPDTTVCSGKAISIHTAASLDFCWSPTTYLDNPVSPNPGARPPVATTYYLTSKITGANLVMNGNFESGNTGFTSTYQYDPNGVPEATYFIGPSPNAWNPGAPTGCGDHTTGNGNMMLINGATVPGVNVWTSQTMTVTPNTNYAFSIWIQSVSPLAPAILQFSINGFLLGSAINANPTTCSWQQFYTTWNSGSNMTATIALTNEQTAFAGNDFALDDISFAPVSLQIDSVTINVETPVVTATPADTTVCPGMPTPLHATGSFAYAWSPATGLSDPTSANPIALFPVSPTATTVTYTVTGTSARGCIADTFISITQYPRLITISPDTLICKGGAAQLYAGSGGTYNWSPAMYLDNPTSATPVAQPAVTTQFLVTLTDANQCTERDSTIVNIKAAPTFQAPPDEMVCAGFGVALKNDNPPGYVYSWTPATGLSDSTAPDPIARPDASMTYSLLLQDSLCTTYDSSFALEVTVLPSPVITAEKDNDIDCSIHSAQLRSTGGVAYVWTPAEGLSDPLSPNPIASIDSTTTFRVKGTGSNGCYAYDTLSVKVTATGDNTFVVPNAFTPNGDGHNDCFSIARWGDVQLEEMDIFDRWGARIFSTRNPNDCWDGTFKGKPQPTGAYPYVIRAHTICGEITKTGIVMLIR